jgi:hypothetical protein
MTEPEDRPDVTDLSPVRPSRWRLAPSTLQIAAHLLRWRGDIPARAPGVHLGSDPRPGGAAAGGKPEETRDQPLAEPPDRRKASAAADRPALAPASPGDSRLGAAGGAILRT